MAIEFYGSLHRQVRDNEDEITLTFKAPASDFAKVILIPTQVLLKISVEVESPTNY